MTGSNGTPAGTDAAQTRPVRSGAGPRMMAAFALVVLTLTAACTSVFRNHGYVPDEADLSAIEVGVDTQDSVAGKIGRPSTEGLLNDVGWFYVQSRFKHQGPRAPEEVDRQVVAVTFTEGGVVENVERYGLEDGRVIEISRRVTKPNIKGLTFIRQLLSNFGRINAGSILAQ